MKVIRRFFGIIVASLLLTISGHAETKDRVTILYDAFSDNKAVTKDWGFSALVEHDGKRILFDTGNNPEIFEHNVKALNVDLTKLDFVVVSHRHTDHASGLKYLPIPSTAAQANSTTRAISSSSINPLKS